MGLDQKLDTPTPHCPKCLTPDVCIEWHPALTREEDAAQVKMLPKWMAREPEAFPERLVLVCNRCRYGWWLLPADAIEGDA